MKHLLRPFSFSATFFSATFAFFAFLLTVTALLPAGPVNAQPPTWTQIKPNTFSGQIHIVKFNDVPGAPRDANGAPLDGFLSDGPEIWYTHTGGQTQADWHLATITGISLTPFVSGWVNDISFKDAMNGAAIIVGNANPSDNGVLLTTNGGTTWFFDDSINTPDSGNGIYWDSMNNHIFVASLDKGFVSSPDGGASWRVIDTNKYYTGFAFASPSRGVVSTEFSNPSGNLPTNFWKYTTDGGLNWKASYMFNETWQPLAIPTTETYFAATINLGGSAIMRSDNDGYSFQMIPTFASGADVLNDCMQGDGCSLFAASTDEPMGIWYSVNDGANWLQMMVPLAPGVAPTPPVNTRFYVSPTRIWSFTTNVLFYTQRVLTPPVHLWPDTVNFTNASCDTLVDTVIHIFGCNCSNNDSLVGSIVTHTQTQDQLTVAAGTVPRPLCSHGMTGPFGNPDSVTISYQPTGPISDTGVDTLKFSANGVEHDTVIAVRGNGAMTSLSAPSQRIVLSEPACGGEADTCITLTNTGCTPITIKAVNTTSDSYCILFYDTLQLPLTLTPGVNPSVTFCIHFRPSLQKIATLGSVQFEWSTGAGPDNYTKPQEVVGLTTTTIQPSFLGFHIGFQPGHPMTCCDPNFPSDTTIYFINTTCDTLTLNQPNIFGSNDPTVFEFNNAKPPIVFPVTIPPNQLIPLGVHINCHQGIDTEKVQFTYTVGTTGTDCSSVLIAMDTAILAIDSKANITEPTFKPAGLQFNGVSCCDSSQTRTVTITSGCRKDTLTGVSLTFDSTKGIFFMVSPLTTPMPLAPNQVVTIQIGYLPRCDSTLSGKLTLTFTDGTTSIVTITANTSNKAEAALSTDQINFDTLRFCDPTKCDTVWVKNASCGAIQIGTILPGAVNPGFTITPPAPGSSLSRGDTVPWLICLDPTMASPSGSISNMLVLPIDNPNGTPSSFDTLTLLAYVVAPIPANTVTPLTDTTICDTSTLDESFTVTNTGQCYTYDILGATTSNTQVTVTPVGASYPVHVAVGGSQTFSVHFGQTAPGILTGMVTLTDSLGNNITVPYDITVDSCNMSGHLVVTMPGNTIVTPNCTPGLLIFTTGAGGGSGSVTSVTVAGSTRFTATNVGGGTMPLIDTVIFDPNDTGDNTATLTISYDINGIPGDTTIPLTATVTGTKFSASIGVTSPTTGCISPNDTDLKEFDVMLYDSIPDSLGVTQLSFVIHYNGDLLFQPKNINFGPGWSVISETPENDGLHITLRYTGTGNGSSASGTALIKIQELGALTQLLSDTAHVTDPHFNDSAYEACVLKAFAASGDSNAVPICIDTSTCQTAVMLHGLQGTLSSVTSIEVVPDPAHKDGSAATLHFTSNVSAPMTVDVLNVLGNSVAQLANGPVEKGDHALAIPTNDMPEGAYFVRISMNGYTVVRKFVLEKE